ncbi:nucleotidyltransferase domain-containing protein [Candidatus Methylobacter oryzae]|uniref:Nucleotidyltransferase family protein n=1 Tax=Candidatus Methylobacter oryzae TaxID=2497749 RepID=A0ABY3CEX7_9GAMM|nr:nucleotidyltransferase family protein [Candidatus Methylobacter oryzae]TRX01791.1 nucleotidyltransferase family protein [Candidatus Methylobacter oryzae]
MISDYHRVFECPLDPAEQGPEFELALTCCRPKPNEAHFLRQQELAAIGLDTRKVLELGVRHKISPLLYCNLRRHPPGTFSNELMDKLAEQHKRNKRRALHALQATHELARAAQGLRLIALKGLDVAARAYGDLAVRHVGDIDILVDPERLDEAITVLEKLKWKSEQPEILLSVNRKILLRKHNHCILIRENFPHMELHWRATFNPFEFPIDDWRALSVSKGANIGIPGLNNEDLVIYLCLHAVRHGWGRLKWLFDLPNVLDKYDINWPQLWQRADQLGAGLVIQQGLLLAQKYCGINLSLEIKSGFRYRMNSFQWKAIYTFQQGPELWMEYPPTRLKLHQWLNRIQTTRSIDALMWYCAIIFYPNIDDYRLLKLPSWLHPLYFPLRPILWSIRQVQIRQARRSKTRDADH